MANNFEANQLPKTDEQRIKSLEEQVKELHAFTELLSDEIGLLLEVTGQASSRVVVPRE